MRADPNSKRLDFIASQYPSIETLQSLFDSKREYRKIPIRRVLRIVLAFKLWLIARYLACRFAHHLANYQTSCQSLLLTLYNYH
ncbi:hypothetical protein DB320_00715 [Helicobacter pylori]|nr:hypothetical protein DB320_00715 [Helicobacter pylori]